MHSAPLTLISNTAKTLATYIKNGSAIHLHYPFYQPRRLSLNSRLFAAAPNCVTICYKPLPAKTFTLLNGMILPSIRLVPATPQLATTPTVARKPNLLQTAYSISLPASILLEHMLQSLQMKLSLRPLNSPQEYNLLLARPELAAFAKFYHAWEWGSFQESLGKTIHRLGIYDADKLVASALLIQERNRFGQFLYCPRGPLTNYADLNQTRAVLVQLIEYAKLQPNIVYLRLDPAIPANRSETEIFSKLGFKPGGRWFVQVGRAWIVDIGGKSDDQLLQWLSEHGMRSNVPRYLRKAIRAGVTVRASEDPADLELFLKMLAALDKRKGGIGTFPPDYYRQQFAIMAPAGLEKIFVAELNGQPLASALIALCRQEASYLHGASYDIERDLHAPQYMHIEIMKYARDHGASRYNFWGVVGDDNFHPGHYGYGYSAFKKSFGGYVELYMPVQDYVFKPLPYQLVYAKEKLDVTRHKID